LLKKIKGEGKMAYKSYDELIEMTVEQVAEYTLDLEENDEIAKINGLEYVEWCGNELDDYPISGRRIYT
jgi:hypothetical protein